MTNSSTCLQDKSANFLSPDSKANLSTTDAKGAWTGERYIESLKDSRQVWYDGQRIDVTSHPSFSGMLNKLASLYNEQHKEENSKDMLWKPEDSENLISVSYMPPRNSCLLITFFPVAVA